MHTSEPLGVKPKTMTKQDVWGNPETGKPGMIRATSFEQCRYFKDIVPYKSITIVCNEFEIADAVYWAEYVLGANCIDKTKLLPDERIAIRCDYQCW